MHRAVWKSKGFRELKQAYSSNRVPSSSRWIPWS